MMTKADVHDIVGKYVGTLEVLNYLGVQLDNTAGGIRRRHWYRCRCIHCGKIKIVRRSVLQHGNIKVCSRRSMVRQEDIINVEE